MNVFRKVIAINRQYNWN